MLRPNDSDEAKRLIIVESVSTLRGEDMAKFKERLGLAEGGRRGPRYTAHQVGWMAAFREAPWHLVIEAGVRESDRGRVAFVDIEGDISSIGAVVRNEPFRTTTTKLVGAVPVRSADPLAEVKNANSLYILELTEAQKFIENPKTWNPTSLAQLNYENAVFQTQVSYVERAIGIQLDMRVSAVITRLFGELVDIPLEDFIQASLVAERIKETPHEWEYSRLLTSVMNKVVSRVRSADSFNQLTLRDLID